MTYEQTIEQLIADLRIDVADELAQSERPDVKTLIEAVHNAADYMQHQLTVLRMMRSILNDAGGGEEGRSRQLLRALEKVVAAAPTLRTEQADIQAALDKGEMD
jgi:hypothetical protein